MIRSSKLQSRFSDFKIYLKPVCLRMFFLGFSAGLPLLLVLGTLGFWLREAGIDLTSMRSAFSVSVILRPHSNT